MFLLTKNYREEEKTKGEKLREIDFYFLLWYWGSTPGSMFTMNLRLSYTSRISTFWSTVHGYVVDYGYRYIYPGLTFF